MIKTMRRAAVLTVMLFLSAVLLPQFNICAHAHTGIPVFLNGEPEYTQTGNASLLSIAADAARHTISADAAVLPALCAGGSLTAGDASPLQIRRALPGDDMLVTVSVSPSELAQIINETSGYGQEMFPHLSGVRVWAERVLNEHGEYKGLVYRIERGNEVLAALPREENAPDPEKYSTMNVMLRLATTQGMAASIPWLAGRTSETGTTLTDVFTAYLSDTSPETIISDAAMPRLLILSDIIDTPLALEKLSLDVPSSVDANLSRPDTVADTIMYELSGQDRDFVCRICRGDIPYALSFHGTSVATPENVSTSVPVTQSVPHGRKTANTFDDSAVFVDLRDNQTLPPDTTISVYVMNVYEAGTELYVYRYDENGDIGTLVTNGAVDEYGCISFPVESMYTYVINSRALNSASFDLPSGSRPYTAGIVCIAAAYAVWFTLFLRKQRSRMHGRASAGSEEDGGLS